MRVITNNDIDFYVPYKIAFVFNPCLFKAEGASLMQLQVVLTDMNGNSKTCSVNAYENRCVADVREYAKTFFFANGIASIDYSTKGEQKSDMSTWVNVILNAYNKAGDKIATADTALNFIWGGMQPGEVFNGRKHLTWFSNYPFTFGVYCDHDAKLTMRADGGGLTMIGITNRKSIVNVSANIMSDKHDRYYIYDYEGNIEQAAFDETFDLTFSTAVGDQSELYVIDVDTSDTGIYLRWVDRHGFYRYWLFQRGTESRAISTDGEYVRNNLWNWDETFGYLGIDGRRQSYAREDTIAICAAHVDSDTFDMLQDLATSPLVDMWTGNGWISVLVKTGTYTKTNATYQDFEANIIRNDIPLQSL